MLNSELFSLYHICIFIFLIHIFFLIYHLFVQHFFISCPVSSGYTLLLLISFAINLSQATTLVATLAFIIEVSSVVFLLLLLLSFLLLLPSCFIFFLFCTANQNELFMPLQTPLHLPRLLHRLDLRLGVFFLFCIYGCIYFLISIVVAALLFRFSSGVNFLCHDKIHTTNTNTNTSTQTNTTATANVPKSQTRRTTIKNAKGGGSRWPKRRGKGSCGRGQRGPYLNTNSPILCLRFVFFFGGLLFQQTASLFLFPPSPNSSLCLCHSLNIFTYFWTYLIEVFMRFQAFV